MDIIYALVPLSILLIGIAVLVFFWAVKSGQFEDLESPAHRILFDDDDDLAGARKKAAAKSEEEQSTDSK